MRTRKRSGCVYGIFLARCEGYIRTGGSVGEKSLMWTTFDDWRRLTDFHLGMWGKLYG